MSARRGQSLVLFMLTGLLMVFMVLITLGLSSRIRDRMELQTATDAAAYSQAVAAARTFNHAALLNRTLIAALSAHSSILSLQSWAGHHVANLDATIEALNKARGRYDDCASRGICTVGGWSATATCAQRERDGIDQALAILTADRQRIADGWDEYDSRAGFRAKEQYRWFSTITGMNLWMYAGVTNKHAWTLGEPDALQPMIARQVLTDRIVKSADPELTALPAGDQKSWEEIDLRSGRGAGVWPGGLGTAQRVAVMGTRGWDFGAARIDGALYISQRLEALIRPVNPGATVLAVDTGTSSFGPDRESSAHFSGLDGHFSWAHDHGGVLTVEWPPLDSTCNALPADDRRAQVPDSWIKMANEAQGSEHRWSGADSEPPDVRHAWADCSTGPICPNMWPAWLDYNPAHVGDASNDFGMPKLYSVVQRDYTLRAWRDPWDIFVNFHFTPAGAQLDTRPGARTLNTQVALGSAIVYYHRPGAWQEPPNFFNPFWRATLVHPDDDVVARLGAAGYPAHAAAVQGLAAEGFEGLGMQ